MLDLAIVIVNYNVCNLLQTCLSSVYASQGDFSFQVCVVDNASKDDSVAMVRNEFPQARLIACAENMGYPAGNNIGLRAFGNWMLDVGDWKVEGGNSDRLPKGHPISNLLPKGHPASNFQSPTSCPKGIQPPAQRASNIQYPIFITLTWALFLLWSKGWSPQWQMMLFPLVLLAFPGRNGVLFCVLFGMLNFLEWPILLSRGMIGWLWLTVSIRTVLLLGLAVAAGRTLISAEGKTRA